MDVLETYRDTVTGLIDIHLSSVSNRLNETRHALTTISTFFIPLTLISGVYGMNFGNNADRLLGHAGVADVFGCPSIVLLMRSACFFTRDRL